MKLHDLEKTSFNDRYGSEIIQKTQSSIMGLKLQEIDWIVTHPNWITFAATVTFKDLTPMEGKDGMKKSALYEYNKRVLNKIRRRLSRSIWNWGSVMPVDYIAQYEYSESSIYKPIPKSRHHHVHGIFAIDKQLSERIFNSRSYLLDDRVFNDLQSIPTVRSFKIEPLILEESDNWYRYICKGKNPKEPM